MDNTEELDLGSPGGGLNALRAIAMGANPMVGLDALTANPTDPTTKGLAFAAGALAPTRGGHFSEAMSNALGAQAESQTKEAELKAKYAPIIAQAMLQRQMMTFNMMAQQYKLTQEWDSALTGAVTGLLHKPGLTPQDVIGAVSSAVQNGTVPSDFARTWIRALPLNDPEKLRTAIMSRAIAKQEPKDRLGSVTPSIKQTDTGSSIQGINENPLAPQGAGAGMYSLPKSLTPEQRLPIATETPQGLRLTSRETGNSAIAGTPSAREIAAGASAQPQNPDYSLVPTVQGRASPPATVPPVSPAPAIGTSAAIDPAKMELDKSNAQALSKYTTTLGESMSSLRDLQARMTEMREAAKNFRPGATAQIRLRVGATLKDLALQAGVSPEKASAFGDKFAGGDISSMQDFQKVAVQGAMEALKSAMQGAGRITQAEFAVFQRNNPNIDMDPGALEKINNFMTKQYQRVAAEHSAANDYVKGGGASLPEFQSKWDKQSRALGYTTPTLETGVTRGSAVPPTSERLSTSKSGRRIKEVSPGQWVYLDEEK